MKTENVEGLKISHVIISVILHDLLVTCNRNQNTDKDPFYYKTVER